MADPTFGPGDLIEAGLRAWTDGDLDTLESLLHPDVRLEWAEPGGLDCVGRDQVMHPLRQGRRGTTPRPRRLEQLGDGAFMVSPTTTAEESHSEPCTTRITVESGLIVRLQQFSSSSRPAPQSPTPASAGFGSPVLAAELATLGDSGTDLSDAVESLHDILQMVVPSAVGLSVTVHFSDLDATVTTLPKGVEPQTSLRFPLSIWADFEAGSEVIFYASTPSSLVDLAADLGWALKLNIAFTGQFADHMVVVDQHITPAPGLSGPDDLSSVNQAVGVLLSTGRSPETAIGDLKRTAVLANTSIGAAARALTGRLTRSVTGPPVDLSALTACASWDGTASSEDHPCGLYQGESQRDEIMLPYLRLGLLRGDQCL